MAGACLLGTEDVSLGITQPLPAGGCVAGGDQGGQSVEPREGQAELSFISRRPESMWVTEQRVRGYESWVGQGDCPVGPQRVSVRGRPARWLF